MDIVNKKGEQASDEEKRRVFQKLNVKLEKIKKKLEDDDLMKVLECLPLEKQISELCKKCKVSVEDYTRALKYSYGRYSITYKRNLPERYVNCYNKELIKAWNGNMDIQVCLDYFAIITYVTDYVSKDDNTLTQVLLEAAKHCKSETARNLWKLSRTLSLLIDKWVKQKSITESFLSYTWKIQMSRLCSYQQAFQRTGPILCRRSAVKICTNIQKMSWLQ